LVVDIVKKMEAEMRRGKNIKDASSVLSENILSNVGESLAMGNERLLKRSHHGDSPNAGKSKVRKLKAGEFLLEADMTHIHPSLCLNNISLSAFIMDHIIYLQSTCLQIQNCFISLELKGAKTRVLTSRQVGVGVG